MEKEYQIQIERTAVPIEEIEARFKRGMEMILPKEEIIKYLNSQDYGNQKDTTN